MAFRGYIIIRNESSEKNLKWDLYVSLLWAKAPAAWHPPVAIVPYYLQHKDGKMDVSCAGDTKASLTPPLWGQGWRKGRYIS